MKRLKYIHHPIFLFLLLPLFYMIFGCVYALQYHSFQPVPFLMLYLVTLLNQIQEVILKKRFESGKLTKFSLFTAINVLLVVCLIYFWISYTWLASLFLLLYSIFIQGSIIFRIYELRFLPAILTLIMNLVLMNGFACYTQAHFISWQAILIVIPQILPFFILSIHQWHVRISNVHLTTLLLLNTGLFIYSYFSMIGYWSLIILFSVPFAYFILKQRTAEAKTLYTLIFSTLGIVCLAIRLFI